MANIRVDLPQADSPTTPKNSPGWTSRSTRSTATSGTSPAYSTVRSRTSRIGAPDTLPPRRPQSGISDLVDAVIEQGHRGAEQSDAGTGSDDPERRSGEQCFLIFGPIQHGSPT